MEKPSFLAMVRIMFHSCHLALWFVSLTLTFMTLPIYLGRKNPWHPINEMLGRPQGQCGEENKLLSLPWQLWSAQPTALSLYLLCNPGPSGYSKLTSTKYMHEYGNKDAHYFQVSVWVTCMSISFITALKFIVYISLALKEYTLWYSSTLFISNIPFQSFIKHNAFYICSQQRTHSFSLWYFHKCAIKCNCWLRGKHKCIIRLAQEIIQNTLQKACSIAQCNEH